MVSFGTAKIGVAVDTTRFDAGMASMQSRMMSFRDIGQASFSAVGAAATAASALAVVQISRFVSQSVEELRKFEGQLANIHTLMDFGQPLRAIRDEIKQLSFETGRDINDIAESYEELFSVDLGAERNNLAKPIDDLALAINVSGNKATELMTRSLKAFNFESTEATRVADRLTATIGVAAAPGEELAAAFGTLASDARTYNIEFESTLALWAALNVQGIEAQTAATIIGNLWSQLANPGTKGGKFFADETGMSFLEFVDEVDNKALPVLEALNNVLQTTDLNVTDIIPERRAGQALSVLTGSGFGVTEQMYAEILGSDLEAASRSGRVRSGVEFQRVQAENQMRLQWQDAVSAWDNDVITPLKQNIAIATEHLGPIPMAGGTLAGAGIGAVIGGPLGAALGGGIGFLSTTAIGQLIEALKGDDPADELEDINRELTAFETIQGELAKGGDILVDVSGAHRQEIVETVIEFGKLTEEAEMYKGTQKEQELNQKAMNLLLEAGVTDVGELLNVVTMVMNAQSGHVTGWFPGMKEALTDALLQLGFSNSEILEMELGTYNVATAAEDADRKFIAMGESIANAGEEVDKLNLTLQDLGLWHSPLLGGPLFRQQHQEAFDADRKFVDPTGQVFGTDNTITVDTGGGGGGGSTPAVRITDATIFSLAQSAARSFAETGEPLLWHTVQSHLSGLIYDDQQFMKETGVDRGFANLRLSDISQGKWTDSPFWYLFEDEKKAADKREKDRLDAEADRQQRLEDQRQRVADAEMDRLNREAERQRKLDNEEFLANARQGIALRGAGNTNEVQRIFDLVLGGAGADSFASMVPNRQAWTDYMYSFGYSGNNPEIGYATFERMWWDWFKDYRDRQLAGDMFGDNAGTDPIFGWSANMGSTARLFMSGATDMYDYIRERDCDFTSEQRRTNTLLEQGNEDRRGQRSTTVNVVNDPMAAGKSYTQRQRTDSVIPNV